MIRKLIFSILIILLFVFFEKNCHNEKNFFIFVSKIKIMDAKVKEFLQNLSQEANDVMTEICGRFLVKREDIITIAYIESGLNEMAVNKIGAMGLFQFLPITLKRLGVNVEEFKQNLNNVAYQLKVFKKYLAAGYKNSNPQETWRLYLYNFLPAYHNKHEDFILARIGDKIYAQNKGLDEDLDGFIKVADIKRVFLKTKKKLFDNV